MSNIQQVWLTRLLCEGPPYGPSMQTRRSVSAACVCGFALRHARGQQHRLNESATFRSTAWSGGGGSIHWTFVDTNERDIPELLGVIETVAANEFVGNLDTAEINIHFDLSA